MSAQQRLQSTSSSAALLLPRLLAGGILLFFSLKHATDLEHFRKILTHAGAPMVDALALGATAAELAAGVLLLTGAFARVGGLLGVATMIPAILTTVKFMGDSAAPFVPPLPLPLVTLAASAVVLWGGAGAFSVDHRMTTAQPVVA